MESFDVIEHLGCTFILRTVSMAIDPLAFQHTEEAFAGRVVTAMPHRAHRADQIVHLEHSLIVSASELAASVRMENNRPRIPTLPYGHIHRSDHHLTILAVMHRPAHHQLTEQINNHTYVYLAFIGLQLGNVRDPLGLRLQCSEVTLQVVADTRRR